MCHLAWPCSQWSQEHTIIGFTRTIARLKKCYPGKLWRFKNAKLKKYPDIQFWGRSNKYKRIRGTEDSPEHDYFERGLMGRWEVPCWAWALCSSSSTVERPTYSPSYSPFHGAQQFYPVYPKKSLFYNGTSPQKLFTIENSSFPNKLLSEKSHLNWIIEAFIAVNPLIPADDPQLFWYILLTKSRWTQVQAATSQHVWFSWRGLSVFNDCC